MNSRFLLLMVVVFLAGAGLVLWLRPAAPPPPAARAPPPATTEVAPAPAAAPAEGPRATAPRQFLILAASWQPAFCETAPGKPECRTLGAERHDASHFALHGLWPRDDYCDVAATHRAADEAGRWSALPPVELTAALRTALDQAMPGTRSQLERHEWIKHGTCFGTDAETYYAASVALLDTLNRSAVRDLFAARIGREISAEQVRDAFDDAFGAGAGDSVKLACAEDGARRIVTEITLGLYGEVDATPDLRSLLRAANPTSPGCRRGIVDPVGAQ
ncbi:MAG: ribonuclease [Devosia sp.]|nr:ribonuclease [Devosia sp.]